MARELLHYRQLERRLWMARWLHDDGRSEGEDATLDEMEDTWLQLSEEGQNLLRLEPPRCWPG